MRSSRNSVIAYAFGALALLAVLAGCGGAGGGGTIVPSPAPSASVAATPPVWPSPVAFDVKTVANLAPTTQLPNGGGFSGTLSTQALASKYTQLTAELQNSAPGVSPLNVARRAQDVLPNQVLAYLGVKVTLAVPSAQLTLAMQIPQSAVVSGASYYLALWDPERTSLGWQHAFAGPVRVDTSSGVPKLTFVTNAPILDEWQQYWLAIYMLPSNAPAPTPAPLISPSPDAVPTAIFTDVQRTMSMADSCSGTPCATGELNPPRTPQPAQDHQVVTNLPFPSHSLRGFTTSLTITPHVNEEGDVLYFTPSLSDALARTTDFQWDFWVMGDQDVWSDTANPGNGHPLTMAALEFDFNDASPGEPSFDYNMSSQCLMRGWSEGGPRWQIWGQKGSGTGWIDSGFQCDPPDTFPSMEWTHITWTYRLHPESLQTQYVSLHVQNSHIDCLYTPNPAFNPVQEVKKQGNPTVEVQFQQDVRAVPTPSPFTEWVDDVTLRAGEVTPPAPSGTPCPVITAPPTPAP